MPEVDRSRDPVAIRATAELRQGWLRRRRAFRWEVRLRDGRVVGDESLETALGGHPHPADVQPPRDVAVSSCPEVGPGAWVGYPSGQLL